MKKVLSIIGILLATAGFLYSGMQIFGTTGKFMEHNGLQSNIKKLTEEKVIEYTGSAKDGYWIVKK